MKGKNLKLILEPGGEPVMVKERKDYSCVLEESS